VLAVASLGACASDPAPIVYAGGGTSIGVFRADVTTGALTLQQTVEAGDQAYLLELDPRHRRAYLQTQLGIPVAIRAFDVHPDGTLKRTGDLMLPHPLVEGVTQIQLHPTASWLLISATGGASGLQDQLIAVDARGALAPSAKVISTDYYGFTWDPTGRYFYGLDGVAIGQFVFDATTGALAPNDPLAAEGSTGHQFLWLEPHPRGPWVYSIEEGAIGLFTADPARGLLRASGYVAIPVAGDTAWTGMVIDPAGRFLYALGYVRGSLLAFVDQFALDAATGGLTFVRREAGEGPRKVTLDSLPAPAIVEGRLLIVGGQRAPGTAVLVVYGIDPGDGTLHPLGAPAPLPAGAAVNFVVAASW
jgi:6-phosphogluconolactonase (cycloisomerase 2 family)